jgi:hypothetical protein
MRSSRYFALLILVPLAFVSVFAGAKSSAGRVVVVGVLARDPTNTCDGISLLGDGARWYRLDNFTTFSLGDTVLVTATQTAICDCGGHPVLCLPNNAIGAWRNFDFGCGILRIRHGQSCAVFISSIYDGIDIGGSEGFPDSARVHLTGTVCFDCYDIPECAAPLIARDRSLSSCETPLRHTTWGRLRSVYR